MTPPREQVADHDGLLQDRIHEGQTDEYRDHPPHMLQLGGLNRRVQPQCASGEVETKPGNANDDGQNHSGADILPPPRPLQTEGVTNTLARGLDLGEQEQSQQGRCDTEDNVR